MTTLQSRPATLVSMQSDLTDVHHRFCANLLAMDDERFESPTEEGKWSPAQHLGHIHMSLSPLATALRMPKWFLKWKFGKANRPSRNYSEVRQRYLEKLEKVPRGFANPFEPHRIMVGERAGYCADTEKLVSRISKRMNRFKGTELDDYILPHPLLGKVTIREMIHNVTYHVQHHWALFDDEQKS